MANRTATLYIRINKDGKDSFCKPVYLDLPPAFVHVRIRRLSSAPSPV